MLNSSIISYLWNVSEGKDGSDIYGVFLKGL